MTFRDGALLASRSRSRRRCGAAGRRGPASRAWARSAYEERLLLSTALVGANAAGSAAGDGDSDFSGVSSVGESPLAPPFASDQPQRSDTRLVFASDTTDLVGSLGGTNGSSNVYVRETATGQTILVSATPGGQPGNGDSDDPVISPDGRYVAFLSQATNSSTVTRRATTSRIRQPPYLYVRTSRRARPRCSTRRPRARRPTVAVPGSSSSARTASRSPSSTPGRPDDRAGRSQLELRRVLSGLGPVEPAAVRVCPGPRGTDHRAGKRLDGGSGSPSTRSIQRHGEPARLQPGQPFARLRQRSATDLTSNAPGSAASSDWSLPDGTINLFLRNLQAGTTTLLTPTTGGAVLPGREHGPDLQPRRSFGRLRQLRDRPDGQSRESRRSRWSRLEPVRPQPDDGRESSSAPRPIGALSSGVVSSPAFSPDGGSLAYLSTATDLTNNTPDPILPPGDMTAAPSTPARASRATCPPTPWGSSR